MTGTKRLTYALAAVLIAAAAIETIAHIIENTLEAAPSGHIDSGWQTAFFSRHFDWHQPDPDLLWRFRPNLNTDYIQTNEVGLIGASVRGPRPEGRVRMLVLGDSSPVGLGLASYRQAFGQILRDLVQVELGGSIQVELVNAAVAGYSSEQVRRWFELHAVEYRPDLVILYVGNNDASISGTVPDSGLLASQNLTGVRRLLSNLATYRLLRGLLINRADAHSPAPDELVVRVLPKRYAENVAEIVADCGRRNVPVVIAEPIVPLLWPASLQFKVFQEMRTGQGDLLLPEPVRQILGRDVKYCIDWTDFRQRYGQADWFTRSVYGSAFTDHMSPPRAVEHYSELLDSLPEEPVVLNNLGVSLWQAGRLAPSRRYLESAMAAFADQHSRSLNPVERSAGAVFPYNLGVSWLSSDRDEPLAPDTGRAVALLRMALQDDYLSLRIKQDYISELRERLSSVEGDGWMLVSFDSAFGRTPATPLGAETRFIDHCHPTAEGHRIIASEILRHLKEAGWIDSLADNKVASR